MTRTTSEWVEKAEGDFNGVLVLRRSRRKGRYDLICFHCQQCAEKYLKARMSDAGISIPKIHDLEILLGLLVPIEPLWAGLGGALRQLSHFAVTTRYPGARADRAAATDAYKTCCEMRELARRSLGLK
jgi:HEPN domain-containing protein